MLRWFKYISVLISLLFWGYLVEVAWSSESKSNNDLAVIFRLEKHTVAPEWMPSSWHVSFFKNLIYDWEQPLFGRSLESLVSELKNSVWVKKVDEAKRTYRGELQLSLEVRRPICLIKNGRKMSYLDEDGVRMELLSMSDPRTLLDARLPEIDVSQLGGDVVSEVLRAQWLKETIVLVMNWMKDDIVKARFALEKVMLEPYRSRGGNAVCRLNLSVIDKNYGKEIKVKWGVNKEYNELEDRFAKDKWDDLRRAIKIGNPISSLDLRYKEPGFQY